MSARIVAEDKTNVAKAGLFTSTRKQGILFWGVVVALLVIALGMRLYGLGLPFDRDGYDEGVYWQTLLSMRLGYPLYQHIFYSQPPFFMLSTYPFYVLFGGTLWSARFGIAIVSLFGFVGAFFMGKSLSGRLGAVAAVLLLVVDSLYLSQSQKIQAEASSVAFSFLAVGAAYLWWEMPEGVLAFSLAALSGVALALGILCKLLSVSSIVPIALLLLARLWLIWRKEPGASWQNIHNLRGLRPIALLIIACMGTLLVILLPFVGAYANVIRDVVTFHTAAREILINNQVHNKGILKTYLLTNLPLVGAALFGLLSALLRRDWRFIPLLAWLLVSMYMLYTVVPLFYRHLIALDPPLIALAVMGLGGTLSASNAASNFRLPWRLPQLLVGVGIVFVLLTSVTDIPYYPSYYLSADKHGVDVSKGLQARVVNDLHKALAPDQLVLTDGQFAAALADRETPPELVDTSMVRVVSGYVTLQQLEEEASLPQVHAVLFLQGRLFLPQVGGFRDWVRQHFHLKYRYGPGQELWLK